MRRITVSMPDELAAALAREARLSGRSMSAIAREAVARHLALDAVGPRSLPFGALGRSAHRHTARRMQDLLAQEWGGGGPRR
ncbi:MAG: ribbon-helix-helix protein, CopG family [Thermoleophilia bacterium]|nr:ribbon-helix-helix protein, CopG family [Thermoleophilia bacterium]